MYRNDHNAANGVWSFTNLGIVSGSAKCTEGYGIGLTDLGVRFADVTGDGKAGKFITSISNVFIK
jgi:hypothetical protein